MAHTATRRAGGRHRRPWRQAGPAAAALAAAGVLLLSGCANPLVDTAATAAVEVARERSVSDAVDDLGIRAVLNHLFFQDDIVLYHHVSFSVIEGRVVLTGDVSTPGERVRAQQIARQAAGVREVTNELQVTADDDILDYVQDTLITTQLEAKLFFDFNVMSLNYDIDTVNGTVYLMGIARSENELALVMEHARSIEHVTQVVSHVVMKDDPRRRAES